MIKKFCLGMLLLFGCIKISYAGTISVDAFISGNDVTISHLESFRTTLVDLVNGNIDSENIEAGSIRETDLNDEINPRVRWDEAFNNFVYTGLLPVTSDSLTSTTSLGTAYIDGYRVPKDATSKAYTASKWTYVDLSKDGTYTYQETALYASEPTVTSNSIRLARVSTDATTVKAIRDDRVLGVQLSTNEDYYRSGLFITVVTPDAITIGTGVIYHGTTRIKKTSNTSLNIGTASDWVGGISGRATTTTGYVVIDNVGNIKLTTTAPSKVDTSGNTTGKYRYSVISGTYYRAISWFYMNGTGSGNIDSFNYSNFKDGDAYNVTFCRISSDISTTSTTFTNLPDGSFVFYPTGGMVEFSFEAPFSSNVAAEEIKLDLVIDGTVKKMTAVGPTSDSGIGDSASLLYCEKLSQTPHSIYMRWCSNTGSKVDQNGATEGERVFKIEEK